MRLILNVDKKEWSKKKVQTSTRPSRRVANMPESGKTYHICVVGSGGVGKSCVTLRLLRNKFAEVKTLPHTSCFPPSFFLSLFLMRCQFFCFRLLATMSAYSPLLDLSHLPQLHKLEIRFWPVIWFAFPIPCSTMIQRSRRATGSRYEAAKITRTLCPWVVWHPCAWLRFMDLETFIGLL